MLKLNKADEEILAILKETFINNDGVLISPDEHTRLWILRALLALSILGLLSKAILWAMGKDVSGMSQLVAIPITLFFGFLFIHINNKSENMSLIIFGLTWASIVLGLYV